MDSKETNTLILGKLDELASGQTEIEKNIATMFERMDQRDARYIGQFDDLKSDIQKGNEGRKVLHQKQDDLEKNINKVIPLIDTVSGHAIKIKKMEPTVIKADGIFKHLDKVIWGLIGVCALGFILKYAPGMIEAIK